MAATARLRIVTCRWCLDGRRQNKPRLYVVWIWFTAAPALQLSNNRLTWTMCSLLVLWSNRPWHGIAMRSIALGLRFTANMDMMVDVTCVILMLRRRAETVKINIQISLGSIDQSIIHRSISKIARVDRFMSLYVQLLDSLRLKESKVLMITLQGLFFSKINKRLKRPKR